MTTEDVAANTEQTKSISEQGKVAIDQLVAGIARIVEQNRETAADTLNQLQTTADEIVKVTDVIDGIADQTNLLALNASTESARAGAKAVILSVNNQQLMDTNAQGDLVGNRSRRLFNDATGSRCELHIPKCTTNVQAGHRRNDA